MTLGTKYFARNPDGTVKRKQPCQTPGCNWPNWHLCTLANPDNGTFSRLAKGFVEDYNAKNHGSGKGHGRNVGSLQAGNLARWDRHREKTRERDQSVISTYKEGELSMKAIAKKYGIAYDTVRKILHNSDVEIRPLGLNVGRQSVSV